jgi:hypothetical protein
MSTDETSTFEETLTGGQEVTETPEVLEQEAVTTAKLEATPLTIKGSGPMILTDDPNVVALRVAYDASVVHVKALQSERDNLKDQLTKALKALEVINAHSDELKIQLAAATAPVTMGPSYAVLDGVTYKITHRDTAKGMNEQFRKRYVEEDATTLVVNKAGG